MPNREEGCELSKDDIEVQFELEMRYQTSPAMGVLRLMLQFDFDLEELKDILWAHSWDISFYYVRYLDVAPSIGLDPKRNLGDVVSFELHRSWIPTALFKDIVENMDLLLVQCSSLQNHSTEKARSCFLLPIFNCLVAQFGNFIQNTPGSLMDDRTTMNNKAVYHFKVFGVRAVVFMEAEIQMDDDEKHLNAIAQLIAECCACEWNNKQFDVSIPIFCILYYRSTFQFFTFDGSTWPYKFAMGITSGSHLCVAGGLLLVNFISESTSHHFIQSLRPICETVFNMLLVAYSSSLRIFRERSASRNGLQMVLDGWDRALDFATKALDESRDADAMRQDNLIIDADTPGIPKSKDPL